MMVEFLKEYCGVEIPTCTHAGVRILHVVFVVDHRMKSPVWVFG